MMRAGTAAGADETGTVRRDILKQPIFGDSP